MYIEKRSLQLDALFVTEFNFFSSVYTPQYQFGLIDVNSCPPQRKFLADIRISMGLWNAFEAHGKREKQLQQVPLLLI